MRTHARAHARTRARAHARTHARIKHTGTDEIKSHSFFAGLDWRGLYNKKLEPPIRPCLSEVSGDGEVSQYANNFQDSQRDLAFEVRVRLPQRTHRGSIETMTLSTLPLRCNRPSVHRTRAKRAMLAPFLRASWRPKVDWP